MPLTLSTVNPDQEDILVQLQNYLATIDSWKGVVESQTGQGILNMIAAVGAFDQASIRRAYQDAFPETVINDEAAYAIADMQGVRLSRKLPASVQATLTSTSTINVPALTLFQGAGGFFFNRVAVFLVAATPTVVTLYEGKVSTLVLNGIDQDYALFVSKEERFAVSDVDVSIKLNNVPMQRTTSGMWTLRGSSGFVDSTLPDGKLNVQFGTTAFGGRPKATDVLTISYAVTSGSSGNGLATNGANLTVPTYPTITGVFSSAPSGGADERPALSYKNLSAGAFGVFDSSITRQQYLSLALSYPGVIDALTFAQREVNPSALAWMNLIKIVLLTSSVWTLTEKANFLAWMQDRTAYAPQLILEDPVAVPVVVNVDIYCFNWVNSTQAKINAQVAVQALFAPRASLLGYDLHQTDLTQAILNADPGIEYVIMNSPTSDVITSNGSMAPPTLVESTSGGTLPNATSYYYGLAVTTPAGIITVRNFALKLTTSATSQITVTWPAYPSATTYQLYRKTGAAGSPPL